MGRDKALVEVGGRALATIAADALAGAGASEVLAVGGDRPALEALGMAVVDDAEPGEGPLGGLLTAIDAARTDVVMVLSCDLPSANAGSVGTVLDALLGAPGAAVAWPESGGRRHVLHAACRASLAQPALATAFAFGERSLQRATIGLPHVVVTAILSEVLHNANRPEDLAPRRER